MCPPPPLPSQAEAATAVLLRTSRWGRTCPSLGPLAPSLGLGADAKVSRLKMDQFFSKVAEFPQLVLYLPNLVKYSTLKNLILESGWGFTGHLPEYFLNS